MSIERERLQENLEKKKHWRKWGPYLSEREWGTVREDESSNGDVWNNTTFEKARSKTYRWGEDGIGGISDNHQRLCFAWTFWNGQDSILKERLFGLSSIEGNHGEDVKECYFYLDNTPTHSYMSYLYKYPQKAFPYEKLLKENKKRTALDPEYDILETGVFAEDRYFDLFIEYAKAGQEDIIVRITASNRGPAPAPLHLFPTFWFRNTWSWGKVVKRPTLQLKGKCLEVEHETLGEYFFYFPEPLEVLFTENETGLKDAFHKYIIGGQKDAVHKNPFGTKATPHYALELKSGEEKSFVFRLCKEKKLENPLKDIDATFAKRKNEADEFYKELCWPGNSEEMKLIQRQAFAGMLWNKQYYNYVVEEWLKTPRNSPRNYDWRHVYNEDVLSVPDKWEYPCFFSWDTAFEAIPLAMIDPEFAKRQLTLLTREWYMHPNGQIPAYEWSFCDVNPPVHAWAARRVYKIEEKMTGKADYLFLESIFQKLLLNFTWWVNRKDEEGRNIFEGGFMGLDNISIFNRDEQIPGGGRLFQSDTTSWMAGYCLNMLAIALELAKKSSAYEDMASKFFEHFLHISYAINHSSLWNEEDGFYYDVIFLPDGTQMPLKVRSMVGLIPLFAVGTSSADDLNQFLGFRKRVSWFLDNRKDLCGEETYIRKPGVQGRRLLSIATPERLRRILGRMLDENEFYGPYGIRSLSKYHEKNPFVMQFRDREYRIEYEPGESRTRLFGGNSNWRGPVWLPLNMLIIESLQRYHHYFGDDFKIECPTGSGRMMNLWQVAAEIGGRLVKIFTADEKGQRPVFGNNKIYAENPHWKNKILFHEYFHGDTGKGLGASHQTGWTGLIAKLIQQLGEYRE